MKLNRCLKYLKGKKHANLNIYVYSLSILKWWVYASYNMHDYYKVPTGDMMTIWEGAVIRMPSKNKLNAKISTEGELVGADDALGQVIWTKTIIEVQGYTVEHNTMHKYNRSTMPLKTNGWGSSGKRTKHIKERYYMVKDTVNRGDLKIKWCLTKEMWADILTKPIQGKSFLVFRIRILNRPGDYNDY